MMISRRPNRRASTENAPGPRKTIAAAIMPAKISDSLASNKFAAAAGRTQNPALRAPRTTTPPAMGVANPTSSDPPATKPSRPSDIPNEECVSFDR